MTVTEAVKDWNNLSTFVVNRVSGEDTTELSQEDIEKINAASLELAKDADIGIFIAKAKKLMNLNILDKKVNFKVFEQFPYMWQMLYSKSIDIVAAECGQSVMAM